MRKSSSILSSLTGGFLANFSQILLVFLQQYLRVDYEEEIVFLTTPPPLPSATEAGNAYTVLICYDYSPRKIMDARWRNQYFFQVF